MRDARVYYNRLAHYLLIETNNTLLNVIVGEVISGNSVWFRGQSVYHCYSASIHVSLVIMALVCPRWPTLIGACAAFRCQGSAIHSASLT